MLKLHHILHTVYWTKYYCLRSLAVLGVFFEFWTCPKTFKKIFLFQFFSVSWLRIKRVLLRRVVAALDEVLKSGENPLDFREPLALDFLPTTLIQELHVVNTSDKICIHPFFSMLLDETWRKSIKQFLNRENCVSFLCFSWSKNSITFCKLRNHSRNDWSWEDVWLRASSQKSTSMARPSSAKDGEPKADWFEVFNSELDAFVEWVCEFANFKITEITYWHIESYSHSLRTSMNFCNSSESFFVFFV